MSAAAIAEFEQNGFYSPISVFSSDETQEFRSKLEDLESSANDPKDIARLRTDLHIIQEWAWDVVHDPRIVEPVADILGPNVLLWSLNWFIKEPRDGKFVSYHQDATYWGLYPYDVATAWIALSDASMETGPMKFVRGSHREPIRDHEDTFGRDNLLSRGQVIDGAINEDDVEYAPLAAGEMSLHHVRSIHGSEPNHTDDRRIGMVLRYCATHVKQTKVEDTAVLVCGKDDYGHFELIPKPEVEMGTTELARHRDALRRKHRALHSKDFDGSVDS